MTIGPVAVHGEDAVAYLAGLNTCFPGWGNVATFDWCFRRSAGAGAADLIGIREAGRLIAGSAVTYRCARIGGVPALVACMTASWTLPEARGRGCFSRLIQASIEQARTRGCDRLTAFTRADNASSRALAQAGSVQLPSWYLRRPRSGARAPAPAHEASPESLQPLLDRSPTPGFDGIVYPTASDWIGQAASRPRHVRGLRVGIDLALLFESSGESVQLLASNADDSDALAVAVQALLKFCAERDCYGWTMDEHSARRLETLGFSSSPGWVHLLRCGDRNISGGVWRCSSVDRM